MNCHLIAILHIFGKFTEIEVDVISISFLFFVLSSKVSSGITASGLDL